MRTHLTLGDYRVQQVVTAHQVWYALLAPDGTPHRTATEFLRRYSPGTSRTYAYLLVDHLRWLEQEGIGVRHVRVNHLRRYLGALGAEHNGPTGTPWRESAPYSRSSLQTMAACLRQYYLYVASTGLNAPVGNDLSLTRLPTRQDRRKILLGHQLTTMASNPLTAAQGGGRRHPRLPPEGAREALLAASDLSRDQLVVTWLADGAFRVGELCSLHLQDLHMSRDLKCPDSRYPHVHICHRENNSNGARVKTKHPWEVRDGIVIGGGVRRASPAMINAYFKYITTDYPENCQHDFLVVQIHGNNSGQPMSPAGIRRRLSVLSTRANIPRVNPHSFRHAFATAVLEASRGDSTIARTAGGWSSARTVDEVYGHPDIDDHAFGVALERVWARSH